MNTEEEMLTYLIQYLELGFVLVDGSGAGAATVDKLEKDGYKVVTVYPAGLRRDLRNE